MTDRTITTTGEATATAEPEIARIAVEARGEAETPTRARRRAAGRSEEIRAAVHRTTDADAETDASAETDETRPHPTPAVRTRRVGASHRSDRFEANESDPAYRVTEQLDVGCAPPAVDELVVAIAEAGGRVTDVTFELTPESRETLRAQAVRAATRDARRRGDAIASVEDATIEGVERVTETDTDDGMHSLVEDALGADDDHTLQPEPIGVSAAVEATYRLQPE